MLFSRRFLNNYMTFYLADAFIQSDVQNSANQSHITNTRKRQIRYNSYRIGSKAMNICPVHKVDRRSQTTIPRQLQLAELQFRDQYIFQDRVLD